MPVVRSSLTLHTLVLVLASLLAAFSVSPVAAGSGGPDLFGYTWEDSLGAVDYNWIDITRDGLPLTPFSFGDEDWDDGNTGFVLLPRPFEYYGLIYGRLNINANGWISFVDDVADGFTNDPLPDLNPPVGTIAVFWDDLNAYKGTDGPPDDPRPGNIWYRDDGDKVIITWEDFFILEEQDEHTFQVILFDDGRIKMQYKNMGGTLESFTLGIENVFEDDGLTVWDDPSGGSLPRRNYAVEISPPGELPIDLDCVAAAPLVCGDFIADDLRNGVANQNTYECATEELTGKEFLYTLDVPVATTLRVQFFPLSGNPRMVLLDGCNPNFCLGEGNSVIELVDYVGTLHIVVDAKAGEEGTFGLRIDCQPLANALTCPPAETLECFSPISRDLAVDGVVGQTRYWCSLDDWGGAEHVYSFDLPSDSTLTVNFQERSGDLAFMILDDCSPDSCTFISPGNTTVDLPAGSYTAVVDSKALAEGAYDLVVSCLGSEFPICGGAKIVEADGWNNSTGAPLIEGFMDHFDEGDVYTVRVDDDPTWCYRQDFFFGECETFPEVTYGATLPSGPAATTWSVPLLLDARVSVFPSETTDCCGALIQVSVTNRDIVPHSFDFRSYHDTAMGDGTGVCGFGPIDAGPVDVGADRFLVETDLLAGGPANCNRQIRMNSWEDPEELKASWQMLPPNLPNVMELLNFDDGNRPMSAWSGLVSGESTDDCNIDDHSLLLAWSFPLVGDTLAPGETAFAAYRIGDACTWTCDLMCQSPIMNLASDPLDIDPCGPGVILEWEAATPPASGGTLVYHVYRSVVSSVDALLQTPLTGGGISTLAYVDNSAPQGVPLFYVIQVEAAGQAGCGDGPLVGGTTDTVDLMVGFDNVDTTGPTNEVGEFLRAVGHTSNSVELVWTGAPVPVLDEDYSVVRSDNRPEGPFNVLGETEGIAAYSDLDAPAVWGMNAHCWYYSVRMSDGCGNLSDF